MKGKMKMHSIYYGLSNDETKALENPDAPNEMELMKENLRLRKE